MAKIGLEIGQFVVKKGFPFFFCSVGGREKKKSEGGQRTCAMCAVLWALITVVVGFCARSNKRMDWNV